MTFVVGDSIFVDFPKLFF
ncbi:Protein of unknown function [Anaplasma phagocytophilum]|uniref:Uncharacterized protein n=1 Tax=Anaplasma phagocytophilum TaxID=948 RepID=A0A098GKN5_ANAPH|nr:Protein of unknown function [Anaplasma phagocytophilum]